MFDTKKMKEDVKKVANYLEMAERFGKLSPTLQFIVTEMAEIFYNKNTNENEKAAALFTIVEAFFP